MRKPHAICVPFPAQGHINPNFKVAKLIHYKGFHITFVHTIYNYNRLLKSLGPNSMDGLSDFVFQKISGRTSFCRWQYHTKYSVFKSVYFWKLFRGLVKRLNWGVDGVPSVTCIVSDGGMLFSYEVAKEVGVPLMLFWTTSVCGFLH